MVPQTIIHLQRGWPLFRYYEGEREEMRKAIQGLVLSTKTKSPGLLFACQASREVILKHYTACLKLGSGKETRFDPENDIIFLSHAMNHYLQPLPGGYRGIEDRINLIDAFSGVGNLAVSGRDISADMGNLRMIWMISRFQSLKSLFVLLNDVHLLMSSLDPLAQSDEQLRLHTLAELGPDTWEKMRTVGQINDEYCALILPEWKDWANDLGDKSYVTDWENLQVKPTILVTSSARP